MYSAAALLLMLFYAQYRVFDRDTYVMMYLVRNTILTWSNTKLKEAFPKTAILGCPQNTEIVPCHLYDNNDISEKNPSHYLESQCS